ncbi:hypothetical protein AVEN_132800-1 [Araneus ventricosus]|uniref:RNase H type-1 domain-containing protein n=1 Tax=Araneus ventricosus TaxID=182803 RepID=A0A4Y2B7R4_ARAVE|nr:hypothetical protein AVEN_132800-1 [Araneus ventricosus]
MQVRRRFFFHLKKCQKKAFRKIAGISERNRQVRCRFFSQQKVFRKIAVVLVRNICRFPEGVFKDFLLTFLLEYGRIRLSWNKARIGIKGNEISDSLAKAATTDGLPASLPFPNIYLKTNDYSSPSRFGKLSGKMVRLADRFTAFFRKYQTNSCTIPENASNSPIAMAPSPPTSRDSVFIL